MFKKSLVRPPPLDRVRFANYNDVPSIMELVNESVSKTFRINVPSDVMYLIENCVLSICQIDINDRIVGFLSVKDYPNIPSIHPQAWEDYIWTKYKAVDLRSRNTIFIHMLCWNPAYAREVVDSMLRSIFMHDMYLNYIAMVKSVINFPLLVPGQCRGEASFRRMQAMERGIPGSLLPVLFVAERSEICPRLRIRRAVEEDNDDIIPIIEQHSAMLKKLYGEFYISELISRHPESDRVLLVCEHNEVAVGIMCLNTQINYSALEENYDLAPFSGLRRVTGCYKDKQLVHMDSVSSITDLFNQDSVTSSYHLPDQTLNREKDERQGRQGKVSWVADDINRQDIASNYLSYEGDTISWKKNSQLPHLEFLSLFEDDDDLEFDIINIDTDLLRVPQLLSYDDLSGGTGSLVKLLDAKKSEMLIKTSKGSSRDKLKKCKNKNNEPRRYSGAPNAFLLEMLAIHHDYDERCGFDILEASFEIFPNRDYCVISLPTDHISFPLLEHFTRASSHYFKTKFVKDKLYIAHNNSIRGKIAVRLAELSDTHKITEILSNAPRKAAVMDLFSTTLTSKSLRSYLVTCENTPVGFTILGPLKDHSSIRSLYKLEPDERRCKTDGALLASVISPAFEPHQRWLCRELLRHSQYTSLFWSSRLVGRGDSHPKFSIISLTGCMIPVLPKMFVPNMSGNKELERVLKQISTPFSLWYIERPLTAMPRVDVNQCIVVVGASSTGLSFLEKLLMGATCAYLTITNVILVSEHGLPTVTECWKAANTCVPHTSRYTDRYLKTIPFYFYIEVVSAVMTKIDRKQKCIHLKGGGLKYYDELVLTCGLQFQHPDYLKESLELESKLEKGKPCDWVLMDDPSYLPDQVPPLPDLPDNVMLINSIYDSNQCLRRLLRMISEVDLTNVDDKIHLSSENRVVVYGACLEAYTCMAGLMELGINADMLAFVEPFPPDDPTIMRVNCFNNETVDERVQSKLIELGIKEYRNCHLMGWRLDCRRRVQTLQLMTNFHIIQIPCFALFYFGIKAINLNTFKAINECGLVYDGALVVGPQFETNDPHIYGAGPCTRYSRILYADHNIHRNFDSEDIGDMLAKFFLRKLDPFVMCHNKAEKLVDILPHYSSPTLLSENSKENIDATKQGKKWRPVLKFHSPIKVFATLPGPLYYLKICGHRPEIPMEVALTLPRQGHTLLTDYKRNYFRLQLNILHCISSLTCLSHEPFQGDLFLRLYGKHESYFNCLLKRFQMKMIDDLFNYFRQPWMAVLYQDAFEDTLDEIRNQEIGTVYDIAKSIMNFGDNSIITIPSTFSCNNIPEGAFGPTEAEPLGTYRNVVENYVYPYNEDAISQMEQKCEDIPTECGVKSFLREEAMAFWQAVGGERLVQTHITKYLKKYNLVNPHYVTPTILDKT